MDKLPRAGPSCTPRWLTVRRGRFPLPEAIINGTGGVRCGGWREEAHLNSHLRKQRFFLGKLVGFASLRITRSNPTHDPPTLKQHPSTTIHLDKLEVMTESHYVGSSAQLGPSWDPAAGLLGSLSLMPGASGWDTL